MGLAQSLQSARLENTPSNVRIGPSAKARERVARDHVRDAGLGVKAESWGFGIGVETQSIERDQQPAAAAATHAFSLLVSYSYLGLVSSVRFGRWRVFWKAIVPARVV